MQVNLPPASTSPLSASPSTVPPSSPPSSAPAALRTQAAGAASRTPSLDATVGLPPSGLRARPSTASPTVHGGAAGRLGSTPAAVVTAARPASAVPVTNVPMSARPNFVLATAPPPVTVFPSFLGPPDNATTTTTTTLGFLDSSMMTSSATSSQPSTAGRTWLSQQRRPRPMPHPTSTAACNSYLLRAGDGIATSDVPPPLPQQPPQQTASAGLHAGQPAAAAAAPMVAVSGASVVCTSVAGAGASAAPSSFNSLYPTTPPTAAATAPPSATLQHLPLTAARARAPGGSGSLVAGSSVKNSPDPPISVALSGHPTSTDDGSPLAEEASLVPAAQHSMVTASASAISYIAGSTIRPSSALATNPSMTNASTAVPFRTRSRRVGNGVGRNLDSHVYLNTNVMSYCELLVAPPTSSATGAGGGSGGGAAAAMRGSGGVAEPSTAAAGRGVSTGGALAPTAGGADARVSQTPRDYLQYPPSPPMFSSPGPAPRQHQHQQQQQQQQQQPQSAPPAFSTAPAPAGYLSSSSNTCTSVAGGGRTNGNRGVVRCVRAEVGDGQVVRVVNGLLQSPLTDDLGESPSLYDTGLQSPSPLPSGAMLWTVTSVPSSLHVYGTEDGSSASAAAAAGAAGAAVGGGAAGTAVGGAGGMPTNATSGAASSESAWNVQHSADGSDVSAAAAAAARAYKANPISAVLAGAQRWQSAASAATRSTSPSTAQARTEGRSGGLVVHPTPATPLAGRGTSGSRPPGSSFNTTGMELTALPPSSGGGNVTAPAVTAAMEYRSPSSSSPGPRTSTRGVLTPANDAANRSVSDTSKSGDMSSFNCDAASASAAASTPTTGLSGQTGTTTSATAAAARYTGTTSRVHRNLTATSAQLLQHRAVRRVNSLHHRQRSSVTDAKGDAEEERREGGEEAAGAASRRVAAPPYAGAPSRQRDGATVVTSLRRFLSAVSMHTARDAQVPTPQRPNLSSSSRNASPYQRMPSNPVLSSSATAGTGATSRSTPSPLLNVNTASASSPPQPPPPPSPPPPPVPPTFALFGALERLSRFSELVQLCREHANVLDDFLSRLTLQLHRNSCLSPLGGTTTSASARMQTPSQSSLPLPVSSPGATATAPSRADREFLRWHRILMYLLRQPAELVKVGVEFFSDAVNSWPLHMLYLTCCYYVTACEHGFDALVAALSGGGIVCSGKGLFAALAVSMAQNEDDLIQSTACMYRAAFYTGVLMRKRHQFFEAETRLTANGGFTLLVVNIPINTLRRLVARVNEGYDVFASMRNACKADEAAMDSGGEGGGACPGNGLGLNSNDASVSIGSAPAPPVRRPGGTRLYSLTSSSGHGPAAASPLTPPRSMPYQPHSVIEVSRVISSRSAVLCGHPLDMLRLDMILARFADFNGVKIHKEYLPAGGPENSYFFNKRMAHELMGLWKARDVAFSLASVHLPVYSPVNGDLWTESMRMPFDPPAPPDAPGSAMVYAGDSNAIFASTTLPPTEGYRDEWWMFSVAEAATCANQDLTYSLRHMRDGSVLLDFSTHAIGIGRLIAWTNKSITVLAAPENRQESSAMPPPRRSPKDEAVRNTMEKLAIINRVLREVGANVEQPPNPLANPSVELFTTFTELGLLEVLHELRSRAGTARGLSAVGSTVASERRSAGLERSNSRGVASAPSNSAQLPECVSTSRLDGAASVGGLSGGVPSFFGPAAGRRMKSNVGALISLNSASASNVNTNNASVSILVPGTSATQSVGSVMTGILSGQRKSENLSLSSAGGAGGLNGLSAASILATAAAAAAAACSTQRSGGGGHAGEGGTGGGSGVGSGVARSDAGGVGSAAATSTESYPEYHRPPGSFNVVAFTNNASAGDTSPATAPPTSSTRVGATAAPSPPPLPPPPSTASPAATPDARALQPVALARNRRRGSTKSSGVAGLATTQPCVNLMSASNHGVPSAPTGESGGSGDGAASGAAAAVPAARPRVQPPTFAAAVDESGCPVHYVPSPLAGDERATRGGAGVGVEEDRESLQGGGGSAADVTGYVAQGTELWHTVSPFAPSELSSPLTASILAGTGTGGAFSSPHPPPVSPAVQQPTSSSPSRQAGPQASFKAEGTSPGDAVSATAPPVPPLTVTPEGHTPSSPPLASRGRASGAVVSDSMRDAPAPVLAFSSDCVQAPLVSGARGGLRHPTCDARRTRGTRQDGGHHPVPHDTPSGVLLADLNDAPTAAAAAAVVTAGPWPSTDTAATAPDVYPLSMYENDFVIRRNNDFAGIVNVYQVSSLITYYEMQFNCVLCDGAVLFAGLLKKASGIAFPSYTLLLCPTVFSLLELWDGYEFEELWKRSLGAAPCSRVTSPLCAGFT